MAKQPTYSVNQPSVIYQQLPPERERGRGCGGCLTGLGVLVIALTIAALVLFLVIKPQIDMMIKDMGGTSLRQVVQLYREVTARVEEADIVKHGYTTTDYNNAKQTMIESGLDVFTDGKIDVEKINTHTYFDDLELTDKQLAALCNSTITLIDDLNLPIYRDLQLNLHVKQIQIEATDNPDIFKITAIALVNTDQITNKMGVLGGLIPRNIYLTSTAYYEFSGKEISATNAKLILNQVSDSSFKQLLNIVQKAIIDEPDAIDVDEIDQIAADLICDALYGLRNSFNATIVLKDGGIILISNTSPPPDIPPEEPFADDPEV